MFEAIQSIPSLLYWDLEETEGEYSQRKKTETVGQSRKAGKDIRC
jgi:hypothetical protein